MSKRLSFRQGFSSMLFWSIISAAFIGPGTVTTASRAGALYGGQLIWALLFSTLATILLQEMAARVTIASGYNLGEIIGRQYGGRRGVRWMIFLSLAFGCAAYEAGNLLGAMSGMQLLTNWPRQWVTLVLGLIAAWLLWWGNYRLIARFMGMLVAVMGLAFMYTAFYTPLNGQDILTGALFPSFPADATLLVMGLIGTTIVPYNLFLGSGIGKGQQVSEMRWGIGLAVLIGGLISFAILLGGSQIQGEYSFEKLSLAMESRLGIAGRVLFGIGLFAAGFSSAITAPLAAAIAGSSLLGQPQEDAYKGLGFRLTWAVVLGVGVLFGVLNIKPIPVIIIAQALNGLLLPIMTSFLLFAANDKHLLGRYANGWKANLLTLGVVWITTLLGLHQIRLAVDATFHIFETGDLLPVYGIVLISLSVTLLLGYRLFQLGKK